jgi:AraC-like DNA-binding protein
VNDVLYLIAFLVQFFPKDVFQYRDAQTGNRRYEYMWNAFRQCRFNLVHQLLIEHIALGDSPAAMRYTEARLKKIGEEMMQDVIGIGGKQLYRKTKAITGRTPVEYIREMRMSRAAELLSQGKFSVSEVMYTVGFSNSSYFSKCFSKEYGMTPTEYMKVKS